jgi:hypothetical protein
MFRNLHSNIIEICYFKKPENNIYFVQLKIPTVDFGKTVRSLFPTGC